MPDDLSVLLREAALNAPVGEPRFEEILRGGRRRQWLRWSGAVALTVLVIASAAFAAAALPDNTVASTEIASGDQGYVFEGELLGYDESQHHAIVRYEQRWATDTYPGTRECTWSWFDDDGSVITEVPITYTSTSRSLRHRKEFTVPQAPAAVEVACGERLDVGEFELSDVRLVNRPPGGLPGFDPREEGWAVSYKLRWLGNETFGATACAFALLSREGSVVFVDSFSFKGGPKQPRTYEATIWQRRFTEQPADVEMKCGVIGASAEQLLTDISAPEADAARAATFARAALEEGDLALFESSNQSGGREYWDYLGTEASEDAWVVSFGRQDCTQLPSAGDCSPAPDRVQLMIQQNFDQLEVTDASGDISERARADMVGFGLAAAPESVGVSTGWVSWTSEPDDHIVYTPFTWTGALPTELDATCRFVEQDVSGETNKDAYVGEEFTLEGPSTEADRDGVLVLELARDMRGAVECDEHP